MVLCRWWSELPPSGRCAVISALFAVMATLVIVYNSELDPAVLSMIVDRDVAPMVLSSVPVGIATIAIAHWAENSKLVWMPLFTALLAAMCGVGMVLYAVRPAYAMWTMLAVIWSPFCGFMYQLTLESDRRSNMVKVRRMGKPTEPQERHRPRRREVPDEGPYHWDD